MTTDTWALDEYNARQEAKRHPLDREMMKTFQHITTRNDLLMEALSPYESWSNEDNEIWDDKTDKVRVFWADQLELHRSPVTELHWNNKGNCEGCDYAGWEGEPPAWPCRTIYAATGHALDYKPQFKTPKLRRRKARKGSTT